MSCDSRVLSGLVFLGSKLGDSLLVGYDAVRGVGAVDAGEWLSLMKVAVKQVQFVTYLCQSSDI